MVKKAILLLSLFAFISGCQPSKHYGALSTSTTPNLTLSNGWNDGALTNSSALNTNFTSIDSYFAGSTFTGSKLGAVYTCGTIAANGACTNSAPAAGIPHAVSGIATLASNTSTITGLSPAFTSSSTYFCVGNDVTTRANPVQVVPATASTVTITDTTGATDNVAFICVGN